MELLSSTEVAAKLGVTPGRVIQLATAGRLAHQKIAGRYVFEVGDVKAFAATRRKPGERLSYRVKAS